MYSLSYICLVNPMYKQACDDVEDYEEEKLRKVFVALNLDDPEEEPDNDETQVGEDTWGSLKM